MLFGHVPPRITKEAAVAIKQLGHFQCTRPMVQSSEALNYIFCSDYKSLNHLPKLCSDYRSLNHLSNFCYIYIFYNNIVSYY